MSQPRQILDGSANIREGADFNAMPVIGRLHALEAQGSWYVIFEWKSEEKHWEGTKFYRINVYESIPNPSTWSARSQQAKAKDLYEGEWAIPNVSVVQKLASQVTEGERIPAGSWTSTKFLVRHVAGNGGTVVGQLFSFVAPTEREVRAALRIDIWITNDATYTRPSAGGAELYLSPDTSSGFEITCAGPSDPVTVMTETFSSFHPKT